jgi:2-isopropylmalate synthase (EC 2.3.3.13)
MGETDRLIIFDTTLRDGEQSPGASMTREEKVRIARALERLQVDVIEAGFPAASRGDFESVQAVAQSIKNSRVCGLARAFESDIERAGEAIAPAEAGRIHTFIATSPVHMEKKLNLTPDEVQARAVAAVKQARNLCDDVEFSPEDAGRSEADFLCRIIEAAIDAGATTINIPDTVGYNLPEQFSGLIRELRGRIPNADRAIWSVHCHNDLGVAVANSLAAVREGARQIECTINGLGERAGNAALEEIVMALRTRQDDFPSIPASRLARFYRPRGWSRISPGFRSSPTKPLSGSMPLPTSRAFTKMVYSSIVKPTKSCALRTLAGAQTAWFWASTRGVMPFAVAATSWVLNLLPPANLTRHSSALKI